jgi:CTD nuclear envelope phosphatase 1
MEDYEQIEFVSKNGVNYYYVKKRPHLDHFLFEASKYYNLIIFTSSAKHYADKVIDYIDKQKLLKHRFYRESCI